ncbi:MAG: IS110 family transposase [Candidatus Dormibacteria bacterium]
MVIIGIDPHKGSHTAAALSDGAEVLSQLRISANKRMLGNLVEWAAAWPQRIWAVEGATGLGLLLAQQLVGAGETVVDVPAKLAARARLLHTGHGRKTDVLDAVSVATVALHNRALRQVTREDHGTILRLLSDRRDELTQERRRAVNRLHRILRDLLAGGAPTELSADDAAKILASLRPVTAVEAERKALARDLVVDVRRIDRSLIANRKRCAEAVAASGTSLPAIVGISDVLAAKILGHTGDITRFATAGHYASYTGTAPIEASSGDVRRHRLCRAGNRSLNNALHLAARVQVMHAGPGQEHYRRKLAEHKTPREALRSLKRQLAKVVYRELRADHDRQLRAAA